MNSRAAVFSATLWLIACRMDNPAYEDGDDVADLDAGSEDTIGSGESSESESANESIGTSESSSMDDVDGSSESPEDSSGTTDVDCAPGEPCGACHVCDQEGACVPNPGADCDRDLLHCSDYLFGAEQGICHRLAETVLLGSCTEQGECKAPSADICPVVKGEVHFACDPVCITNPLGCEPGAFAADVDMAAMCAVQGEGPGCHTTCSNDNNSVVQHRSCSQGECIVEFQELCTPYACNPENLSCFGGCENDLECAQGYSCDFPECVLP